VFTLSRLLLLPGHIGGVRVAFLRSLIKEDAFAEKPVWLLHDAGLMLLVAFEPLLD
jgi:hypothetical protein